MDSAEYRTLFNVTDSPALDTFEMMFADDSDTSSSVAASTAHSLYTAIADNYTNSTFTCPPINLNLSKLFVTLFYGVVFLFGLGGNSMVIYVVARFSNMQTVTNMYILNLAVADICYLSGIPFLLVTMHNGGWIFGTSLCKMYMISTSITQFTSSIFLLIMSADRYIAICHHISSPKYRTPSVSRWVSVFAWCLSAAIMTPIMLYAETMETGEDKYTCNVMWPDWSENYPGSTFTLYSLFLGFVIPLLLISVFYMLVVRKLHKVSSKTTTKTKNKRRSHRKVTRLVVAVVLAYIVFWMPHWVSQVALIFSSVTGCSTTTQLLTFLAVGLLGYVNSAANPILYAYLSENFMNSLKKACRPFTRRRDMNAANVRTARGNQPKRIRDGRMSESQVTMTTRCPTTYLESNTTMTAMSNMSSRNPSPPTDRNDTIPSAEHDNEMLPLSVAT